jgi:hypothetical protein
MADDGQMMVAKTVGKNFAYLTYQQICASGVVHTTTFQQSHNTQLPDISSNIPNFARAAF